MSRASKQWRRQYKVILRKRIAKGPFVWERLGYGDWGVSRYTKKGYEFVGAYPTEEQAIFEAEFLKILEEELSINERDCSR